MAQYRKKPVVVEAIQFNGNSNLGEIESFVGKELKSELESDAAYEVGQGPPIFSLLIETKEGVMKAFKGDYIIKEPFPTGDRDFYPCKPDIFEATYEGVDEEFCSQACESCEAEFDITTMETDADGNWFCPGCWKVLEPVMRAEYEEMVANGEIEPEDE